MEHLRNNVKILIVVEGKKTEKKFFENLTQKFGIKAELYIVGTNLYALYDRMKEYQFECDVKEALREIVAKDCDKEMLKQNFTYTYLVFDSDLQHKQPDERGKDIDPAVLAEKNFSKLEEMAGYFTDETDPSIGRLYINYPMMESYRYCDKFYDEKFLNAKVSVDEMKKFKNMASKKKLCGIHIDEYSKENFSDLIRMNIRKLNLISRLHDNCPKYTVYTDISGALDIAETQHKKASESNELSVLNQSLFIAVDYFGNRDNFYDRLIKK